MVVGGLQQICPLCKEHPILGVAFVQTSIGYLCMTHYQTIYGRNRWPHLPKQEPDSTTAQPVTT